MISYCDLFLVAMISLPELKCIFPDSGGEIFGSGQLQGCLQSFSAAQTRTLRNIILYLFIHLYKEKCTFSDILSRINMHIYFLSMNNYHVKICMKT